MDIAFAGNIIGQVAQARQRKRAGVGVGRSQGHGIMPADGFQGAQHQLADVGHADAESALCRGRIKFATVAKYPLQRTQCGAHLQFQLARQRQQR